MDKRVDELMRAWLNAATSLQSYANIRHEEVQVGRAFLRRRNSRLRALDQNWRDRLQDEMNMAEAELMGLGISPRDHCAEFEIKTWGKRVSSL